MARGCLSQWELNAGLNEKYKDVPGGIGEFEQMRQIEDHHSVLLLKMSVKRWQERQEVRRGTHGVRMWRRCGAGAGAEAGRER